MSGKTIMVAAIVLAVGIVLAVAISTYFSPFQTCTRERQAHGARAPATVCAQLLGGGP